MVAAGAASEGPPAGGQRSEEPAAREPAAWDQPEAEPVHATEVSHQTAPDSPTRVRRGRKAVWLGVVALLSVVGLLAILFGPLQRVEVPDVLGRTPTEALAILAASNLVLDADRTDYSEDYPDGQIMATDPAPADRIRTGGTILATVSKGPERYDVPKLKGLTVDEADVALAAVNLELGVPTEVFDDKVKDGDIVRSTPKAGTSVKPGTAVAIEVSKGPAPVTLPTLVGGDADAAEKQLADLGLTADRSGEFSESVARGLVISMSPEAGTTVYRGDTVSLVVSKGPPLVEVPSVVRMREKQARAALEGAGLVVRVNKPAGFEFFGVSDQTPEAGEKVPKGTTVTITVV